MNRIHGIENALNIEYLSEDFITAIQKAWCYETCWDGCKDGYLAANPELDPQTDHLVTGQHNPSFGNCFVTSLAAAADLFFKADLIPCLAHDPDNPQPVWHFFLSMRAITGWVDIDPTRQQFAAGHEIEVADKYHPARNEILYYSIFDPAENKRLRERLGTLLNRMEQHGYEPRYTADEIIDRMEKEFAAARLHGRPVPPQKQPDISAATNASLKPALK